MRPPDKQNVLLQHLIFMNFLGHILSVPFLPASNATYTLQPKQPKHLARYYAINQDPICGARHHLISPLRGQGSTGVAFAICMLGSRSMPGKSGAPLEENAR